MGILSIFGHGFKQLFGNDPRQQVEASGELATLTFATVEMKKGGFSKENAAILVAADKNTNSAGKDLEKKQEGSVYILPSDMDESLKSSSNTQLEYDAHNSINPHDKDLDDELTK